MAIEETKPDSSPPMRRGWRRWFQYRLRTLMVLMLLAGIGMNWLKKRAETQKAAVDVVLGSGGFVCYDYQLVAPTLSSKDPRAWNLNAELWWPRWIRSLLGDDYFRTAIAADVFGAKSAKRLGDLSGLQYLHFWGPITDADLAEIPKLDKLRCLDLSNTWITDAALAQIGGLDQLQELDLATTQITDAGLESIGRLSKLKYLTLPAQISPQAKAKLGRALSGCKIY